MFCRILSLNKKTATILVTELIFFISLRVKHFPESSTLLVFYNPSTTQAWSPSLYKGGKKRGSLVKGAVSEAD